MRKTWAKAAVIGMFLTSLCNFPAWACEADHWIQTISSDGSIIKLDDGSIWKVDPIDTITSRLWLPTSEIVACDDKLVNTDDGEKVDATRLR